MLDPDFTEQVINAIRTRLNFGQNLTELAQGILEEYENVGITPADVYLCYKSAILLNGDLDL